MLTHGRGEGRWVLGYSSAARPGWQGLSLLSCRNPHVPSAAGSGPVVLGVSVQLGPWHGARSAGMEIRLGRCRSVSERCRGAPCTHRKENNPVLKWLGQNWSWLWIPPVIIQINSSTWVCHGMRQVPEASPGTSPAAPGMTLQGASGERERTASKLIKSLENH